MSERFACELSVIAPCYNESANLPELVERVRLLFARRELTGVAALEKEVGGRQGDHPDAGLGEAGHEALRLPERQG